VDSDKLEVSRRIHPTSPPPLTLRCDERIPQSVYLSPSQEWEEDFFFGGGERLEAISHRGPRGICRVELEAVSLLVNGRVCFAATSRRLSAGCIVVLLLLRDRTTEGPERVGVSK